MPVAELHVFPLPPSLRKRKRMDVAIEAPFAVSFPLPYRVFALVGIGILGWATNLHGLHALGIDASSALDIHPGSHDALRISSSGPPDILGLARAVYRICAGYSTVVFLSWALFRLAAHDSADTVDMCKWIPVVTAMLLIVLMVTPGNILERRVREMFLAAVKRCLFVPPNTHIFFCDVVLADILTSFAKVIGDIGLSLCMAMPGGSLLVFPEQRGWSRLMVPVLMSLPYAIRFRQCLVDFSQPTTTSRKQLYNALKYASSFPVIFLSAAQRAVSVDPVTIPHEHALFRLWLLAGIVNSTYSFWWDVTNDWGFELLHSTQTFPRQPPRPLILPSLQARKSSGESRPPSSHPQVVSTHPESPFSSLTFHSHQQYPWGLRQTLLYPLPLYPMAIFLNLLLRLTWSIKLSAHLHMSGALLFFWLEVAELLRRWLWVFFRVEWECVRKMSERDWNQHPQQRSEEQATMGFRDRSDSSIELNALDRNGIVFDAVDKPRDDDTLL